MKKAVIKKVETKENSYIVTYESGAKRTYKADKLPKTVRAYIDAQDPFFKDASSKAIFWLICGSGEMRTRELGVTAGLYRDKEAAKAWHRRMIKLVHPDNCDHPMAAEAAREVTRMYNRMMAAA